MTHRIFRILLLFFFSSCDKKLDKITVTDGVIEVTKYEISDITTVHDFIEVKKGDSVINVAETESYGFADIMIKHDTIIIQYLPTFFYKITDNAFNYKIKLDTTISVDYWRQKAEEQDKHKK